MFRTSNWCPKTLQFYLTRPRASGLLFGLNYNYLQLPLNFLKWLDEGIIYMAETKTPEQQGTRVTFLDQTGAKSVEAVVSDTITVRRILPSIITKMNLPVVGPDGQPMSYSLDHKEGGRRLDENQTLVEASVATGDHLIIYPEIVAG